MSKQIICDCCHKRQDADLFDGAKVCIKQASYALSGTLPEEIDVCSACAKKIFDFPYGLVWTIPRYDEKGV